jgi:hypothetical protein
VQVADEPGVVAEQRLDLATHVVGVQHGSREVDRETGASGGEDGQVRSLLRHESARPHRPPAPRTRLPPGRVDAVGHHLGLHGVGPGRGGVPADGGERRRAARHRDGRLEPAQRRGVQRRHHRHRQHRRHRHGEVVEAVVVHDVEARLPAAGEPEHERQVGVVLAHPRVRVRAHVGPRRRARLERRHVELLDVE